MEVFRILRKVACLMGLMVLATTMEGVSGALGQRIPLQQKFPSRRCSEGLTASGEGLAVVLGLLRGPAQSPLDLKMRMRCSASHERRNDLRPPDRQTRPSPQPDAGRARGILVACIFNVQFM